MSRLDREKKVYLKLANLKKNNKDDEENFWVKQLKALIKYLRLNLICWDSLI